MQPGSELSVENALGNDEESKIENQEPIGGA